ncbi:MAG: hypothetical protein KDD44_13030, partial [Bdellovibrionales bacterium]|nr:hypothetical protein [Bdellovibrionales bacterium]
MALFPLCAHAESTYFRGYRFSAEVIPAATCGTFAGREGMAYSVRLSNPLPVRVAAALTVDGLNSIDGSATDAQYAPKWIIEPYGTIEVRGWQTGPESLRRFVITRASDSYARWRERMTGIPLDGRLGEIEVAYFWNSSDLQTEQRWRSRSGVVGAWPE